LRLVTFMRKNNDNFSWSRLRIQNFALPLSEYRDRSQKRYRDKPVHDGADSDATGRSRFA
jgi:hypothetical protein